MSSKRTVVDRFHFNGGMIVPAYGSPDSGPWVSRTVETGGTPTVAITGGVCSLDLDNTEEVQNACLYMLDKKPFDIDDLIRVDFKAALAAAAVDTAIEAVVGLAGSYNATPDSVAQNAWFKIVGTGTAHTVAVESDDGTNDNDDKATGLVFTTTFRRCRIDFVTGHQTIGPPGTSKAGTGAVWFLMEDGNGVMRRVASGTNFDMSNYTSGLQLYAQIKKTSDTGENTLKVKDFEVTHIV